MKIVDRHEMKQIEQKSFSDFSLNEQTIIENVGINLANQLEKDFLHKDPHLDFVFFIGAGHNGADGLAAARHLYNRGYRVNAFVVAASEQELSAGCLQQKNMAQSFGVHLTLSDSLEDIQAFFQHRQQLPIVVDALFGTGIRLPLSNALYDLINFINENNSLCLAVDLPSGVDVDSGETVGNAIKADVTYAIGLPKVGCFLNRGVSHSGLIRVLNAGFPQVLLTEGSKEQIEVAQIAELFRSRSQFGDKRVFGHIMLLGGSHGLTGALVLASSAALKIGAGLVTGATWEHQYQEFIARLMPEVMTGYIPSDESEWKALTQKFERYDSLVIGPGLGGSALAQKAVRTVLGNFRGPIVIDADGIHVVDIQEDQALFKARTQPTILTPHFGEFARLMQVSVQQVRENTISLLNQCVEKLNCCVVLKGPCTYMAFPSGQIYFNFSPNDGMATGGTGDVLAGILGGLLGQDHSLRQSNQKYQRFASWDKTVALAVLLHSRAGHYAAKELGARAMVASSLIDYLPHAFEELESKQE